MRANAGILGCRILTSSLYSYSALKNMRKIETTQLIMQNHTSREFAFFEDEKHQQNRMLYYQVLCKILFAEDNCEREFEEFMKPFEMRFEPFESLDSVEAFRQEPVRVRTSSKLLK